MYKTFKDSTISTFLTFHRPNWWYEKKQSQQWVNITWWTLHQQNIIKCMNLLSIYLQREVGDKSQLQSKSRRNKSWLCITLCGVVYSNKRTIENLTLNPPHTFFPVTTQTSCNVYVLCVYNVRVLQIYRVTWRPHTHTHTLEGCDLSSPCWSKQSVHSPLLNPRGGKCLLSWT